MNGKDVDLLTAGFVYVARCLVEGDTPALRRMGLGWPELRALNRLGLGDVLRLVRQASAGHFLEIRFDRRAFQQHLERLEAERQAEDRRLALIQGDAPQAMLHELFGMTLKESTTAIAGCSAWDPAPSGGRPPPMRRPFTSYGRRGRLKVWIGPPMACSRNTIWPSIRPRGFPCARSGTWRGLGRMPAPEPARPTSLAPGIKL